MIKKIPASKLKILLWSCNPEIYISLDMLQNKTDFGNSECNKIILSPRIKTIRAFLDTLIHELLHVALPDAEEGEIRSYTKKVVRSLTGIERVHLLIKLGQHLKKVDL
jgi:hypothetical protein